MNKKLRKTINNAKRYCVIHREEVFIIESEGEYTFCTLKSLNHLNDLKLNFEIIFKIYQDTNDCIQFITY